MYAEVLRSVPPERIRTAREDPHPDIIPRWGPSIGLLVGAQHRPIGGGLAPVYWWGPSTGLLPCNMVMHFFCILHGIHLDRDVYIPGRSNAHAQTSLAKRRDEQLQVPARGALGKHEIEPQQFRGPPTGLLLPSLELHGQGMY